MRQEAIKIKTINKIINTKIITKKTSTKITDTLKKINTKKEIIEIKMEKIKK